MCVCVCVYLPFNDKLHAAAAAAVCKNVVPLMMAKYSQPKHVWDVKGMCSS
jgi:hypothetical protein